MILIRPAVAHDVVQLTELVRRSARGQEEIAGRLQLLPGVDWTRYVARRMRRDDAAILVAEEGGRLLGYVEVRLVQPARRAPPQRLYALLRRALGAGDRGVLRITRPRRFGVIEDIYVEPLRRVTCAGVAFRLYQHGLQWFQGKGVTQVEAAIWARNELTRRLVKKLGFETVQVIVSKSLEA